MTFWNTRAWATGPLSRWQRVELWPVGVFAGRFVSVGAVNLYAVKLPFTVLIDRTDPDVTDALPWHAVSPPKCQFAILDP
jgi:hypothetical protein